MTDRVEEMSEADKQNARDMRNALGTPEAAAAWMALPQNSQQAATPEQIQEWVKAGGSLFRSSPLDSIYGRRGGGHF